MTQVSEGRDTLNVDRLYDYTKFHIGIYSTLVAALLAFVKLQDLTLAKEPKLLLLYGVVVLFAAAGAFGGIVCTNCIHFKSECDPINNAEPALFWGKRCKNLTIQ